MPRAQNHTTRVMPEEGVICADLAELLRVVLMEMGDGPGNKLIYFVPQRSIARVNKYF